MLSNVASSVIGMLYNAQLIRYLGKNGVSAYGVLMYVQFIFLAIEIGFTIGSAPIISYHFGAESKTELKNVFQKSVILMCLTGVILTALAQLLAMPLAKLFVGYNPDLYELTVTAFRVFSFSFLFSGINIFASGFFTALNNGAVSAVLSFSRTLVFQIIAIFLLPALFGIDGIWWAMFGTESCALLVSVSLLVAYRKKYKYL